MSSLLLSDGARTLEVLNVGRTGIMLSELNLPTATRENTYTDSADGEGKRRVRSRSQNVTGNFKVVVAHTSGASFWDLVDDLGDMVESVHRERGVVAYTPPGGSTIYYDIESMQVLDLPQVGQALAANVAEVTVEFECLPYGRLDPVTILSSVGISGPIGSADLVGVPGHVHAYGDLTLTDTSSQNRGHIEVAIQEVYDSTAPEPLALYLTNGLTVTGYAGSSVSVGGTAYGSNAARATLSQTPLIVCATTAQVHKGLWKPRLRASFTSAAYADDDAQVRLAYQLADGPLERTPWVGGPGNGGNWCDLDLGTINLEELPVGHSWTGYVEAYTQNPTVPPFAFVDTLFMVPA